MKFKNILYALCLMPYALWAQDCATRTTVPAGELTLPEIIELGLCRNPNTSAAFLNMRAAQMNRNVAAGQYLPSVTASIGYQRQYRLEEWRSSQNASLSANWLIFDFGRRYSEVAAMNHIWRATGFDYSATTQQYIFDLISAYYGMLGADAEVRAATELVGVARTAYQTANTRFRAGAVARADVLRAETTLAQRELELQRARGSLQIARGRLLFLLSFPQDQDLNIAQMPAEFASPEESRTISEMIERARERRPDLLAASANTNAAWHRRNAAFLRNLPTISASGNLAFNFNANYDAFGAGPDTRFDGSSIGIRASMPIFAGFANANNLRAAQFNYDRANEQLRARGDAAAMDIWSAYQNYQTARHVLSATNALLASSQESERVVSGMYRVGRATMLDWQTAQADLASAQRQNITARYDLFVRRASLALAMGELGPNLF